MKMLENKNVANVMKMFERFKKRRARRKRLQALLFLIYSCLYIVYTPQKQVHRKRDWDIVTNTYNQLIYDMRA